MFYVDILSQNTNIFICKRNNNLVIFGFENKTINHEQNSIFIYFSIFRPC